MMKYYYLGILILGIISIAFVTWYGLKHWKKQKTTVTLPSQVAAGLSAGEPSKTEPMIVLLYHNLMGEWDDKVEISGAVVDSIMAKYHSLGQKWNEDGIRQYHIVESIDSAGVITYDPIETFMEETRDNPPEHIYNAFYGLDWMKITHNVTDSSAGNKSLTVAVLLFCGFIVFILFMWGSSVK